MCFLAVLEAAWSGSAGALFLACGCPRVGGGSRGEGKHDLAGVTSRKGTSPVTSCNPNYLAKAPGPDINTAGGGCQHMNLGVKGQTFSPRGGKLRLGIYMCHT